MAGEIIADRSAYDFLRLQRGALWNLTDPAEWWAAYRRDLFETFDSLVDMLPHEAERVLDIGGGIGGINIHVAKAFARQPEIVIVDGVADECRMTQHRVTFNSAACGERFLAVNGVEAVRYVSPTNAIASNIGPCDLVLSFQAWPFHIPVEEYLNLAKRVLKPGGLLVVDVRRDNDKALAELAVAFRPYRTLKRAPKFDRIAYVGK